MYKRRERRTAKKRKTRVKTAVKEAFGNSAIPEDSSLFQAVCGFIEGSQDGKEDDKWYVADYIQRLDKTEHGGKATRATKTSRKELLSQMVTYMYDGEVVKQLERNVIRKKRFSTVKLARVSDMNSTFNPSALGAIASCEGGKKKGEMGLLCAESTLRRCVDQVLLLADFRFSDFPLTSLPAWDNVAQLRVECVKRCVGPYAGWYARISKKSGRGTMMNAMEL